MGSQLAPTKIGKSGFYNRAYQDDNYFLYRRWLYEPYISTLIDFCGLRKGASVLDVGCGQGFFSYLFSQHGMAVRGIDISETGIRKAKSLYGHLGISFELSDICTAPVSDQFDCMFVRSCSLYNRDDFAAQLEPTATILKHLKKCGTLIFAYNSNFSSKRSARWRFHTLSETRKHFNVYGQPSVFVQNKISAFLFRKYSLSRFVTLANIAVSTVTRTGGEIVCVLKEPQV